MTKLFVGNLSFSTNERELNELFSQVGPLESARIITDRDTGRSRGFGFVEFNDPTIAAAAIQKFHGYEIDGRELTVNEARPQAPRFGGNGRSRGDQRSGNNRW